MGPGNTTNMSANLGLTSWCLVLLSANTSVLSASGGIGFSCWRCVLQSSASVFKRLHKRSASHGEDPNASQRTGSGPLAASLPQRSMERSVVKRKKLLFVHFRINRVHCRVTYKVRLQLFTHNRLSKAGTDSLFCIRLGLHTPSSSLGSS